MFRFTIRDVLWLTVVVACLSAWWSDNERIEKAVSRLEVDRMRLHQEKEDELTFLRELQAKQEKLVSHWVRHAPPLPSHNAPTLTAAQTKVMVKIFGDKPPNSP